MELSANYQKISELKERLSILSMHLVVDEKRDRLDEVRLELENSEIWSDPITAQSLGTVSYTHLTLPTIYSV